VSNYF